MTSRSDLIKSCKSGAVNNPFQGEDLKVLFVCYMGILRSATGARLYAHKHNTRACGVSKESLIEISQDLIDWADEIVFVHDDIAHKAKFNFSFLNKKVVVLDIPDNFDHMDISLVRFFDQQYKPVDKRVWSMLYEPIAEEAAQA